jgi:acyl-CoA dehydrogenase
VVAAPDSGNAEILAHYGTEEQKKKYLEPLLAHEMSSCFSMTEPQAGSDPREFVCRARLDGDEWVIEGEKWFSSHARLAGFLIVMAITDPKVSVHQGASMFLVPTDTPGIRFLHHAGIGNEPMNDGYHAHILYDGVRVSKDNLLGEPGTAFQIAQTRLSGGRIHHAMRTIGKTKWALRIMCERALSRRAQGERLADKQMVQDYIGRSFTEIEQFRLLVLYTAWLIDKGDRTQARVYVAAVKAQASEVIHDVMRRCLQVHGSLGISNLMPLQFEWLMAAAQGVMDGPSEVHRFGVAKHVLKQYEPYEGIWPKDFLPQRLEAAKKKFAELLEHDIVNF